jgi:hypothetical protein
MEKTKHVSYRRWASWCHPCGVENKELANIYSEFKSSGFEIISIAMDNDRFAWLNAILTDSSSWINHCDF